MNDDQLVKVVARIQAGDNRSVDSVTIAHWRETIGHLDYQDAYDGVVRHFLESPEYLMPAHVVAQARRLRQARISTTTDSEICAKWGPKFADNGYCSICGLTRDDH